MTSEVLREHPEILFNQTIKKTYKLIKLLGKGTFSVVYQCIFI
jgi:predicted Ser/Thr protein kinase